MAFDCVSSFVTNKQKPNGNHLIVQSLIKNKAIFLDRDGTLIKSLIKENTKNLKLRPPYNYNELKVFGDLSFLNLYSKKYLLIIVSNQPDLYTKVQSLKFHNFINLQIKKRFI